MLQGEMKVTKGRKRSNFHIFLSGAFNVRYRGKFVLSADRKLGMANTMVQSDLTFDLGFKVVWRSY